MLNKSTGTSIPYDNPATYQISVLGRIHSTWSDRLEDMVIVYVSEDADSPITTLEGELSDQAALVGVLNTLYELHMTVISVTRLNH